MVPAARLAASAMSPLGAIAMPETCLPALTVAIILGGFVLRSMTKTLSSGTFFQLVPSGSGLNELATSAISPEGWIAKLVGGPAIVFIRGMLATIVGSSGFEISTIESVS